MRIKGEIFVVPFFGQGHLFPCMELCRQITARNYKTTLVITSNLSTSVPSALRDNPLVEIAEFPDAPSAPPPPKEAGGPEDGFGPRPDPFAHRHQKMARDVEAFLSARPSSPTRQVCAVIDVMMTGFRESFAKFDIPAVSFSTSGAVSAAMECATWQADLADMKPGEIRNLPGLPDDMAVTYLDTKRRPRSPPRPPTSESEDSWGPHGGPSHGPGGPSGSPPRPGGPTGGRRHGPPTPGGQPPWWDEVGCSIALLINSCGDLERPFIEYVEKKIRKPVWGVGPLLPEQYWNSVGTVLRDREFRPKRKSNYTEEEVIQWLDSKPRGSVIYVSFGSEVSPTLEEYGQLADALAESNHLFIWVIQPGSGKHGPPPSMLNPKKSDSDEEGYYPYGLEDKVGDKGRIIRGWAPQLMILSHPSTGGFLSHCGWNSTMEATGRRVPFLAWPIRGDQFYNAKLLTCHLRVGYMITEGDLSAGVRKEDILKGIDRLMSDDEIRQRAAILGSKFESGFPSSSAAALDAFGDFILRKMGSMNG